MAKWQYVKEKLYSPSIASNKMTKVVYFQRQATQSVTTGSKSETFIHLPHALTSCLLAYWYTTGVIKIQANLVAPPADTNVEISNLQLLKKSMLASSYH